jgi:predicted ester cyclase
VNKIEIVKKAFSYDTPPEEQSEYLTDDYQFVDSVGSPPMDKEAWFGMGELMQASIPDIDFIIDEIHQEGEDVILTGHFTGTFKNDLDLSAMNMGVIPATGKAIDIPGGTSRISFTGDKISKNHNLDTGPNAGMAGFLAAFGGS